jgi:selenide,water dikinase
MCEGSQLAAVIEFEKVPVIPSLPYYLEKGCFPGGTTRNWNSYGSKIGPVTDEHKYILADPQTSGGLLVAVAEEATFVFEEKMKELGHPLEAIGRLMPKDSGPLITVV